MFEWLLYPWAVLGARAKAKQLEDERLAQMERDEQAERAANILAASLERKKASTLRVVAPLSARQAVLAEQEARQLWQAREDKRAAERIEEEQARRRRNAASDAENSYMASLQSQSFGSSEPKGFVGGGGTFDGGGASGGYSSSDSGSCGSSSSSSSSDSSSSSSSSDSGSSSCGGSD